MNNHVTVLIVDEDENHFFSLRDWKKNGWMIREDLPIEHI